MFYIPHKKHSEIMYHLKPFQTMSLLFFFCLLALANPNLSISATLDYLNRGSSLSPERSEDILSSPDRTFSAGFQSVGNNSYCFAIWYTRSANFTPVWMANRDQPVNGRRSTLTLHRGGNLVLKDAGRSVIWETGTNSASPVQLRLMNTGNLVLNTSTNTIIWQSFDFPTDTLLPQQLFSKDMKLVSSRSRHNYSSGFYSFFFDYDNVLRLLYNGPNISSIYWPDPGLVSWDAGRSTYNSSRIAVLNSSGYFQSSDHLSFFASDFGLGPKRRLTMDYDGNLRVYSLEETRRSWMISWLAISNLCTMHGLCGPNSICVHEQSHRRCSCAPGFKLIDQTDLSLGCQPAFNLSCDAHDSRFITVPYADFYGYDLNYTEGLSFQQCMDICLESCSCKAFLYKGPTDAAFADGGPNAKTAKKSKGWGQCFPKTLLLNGYTSPSFTGTLHIRVPRNVAISDGIPVRLQRSVLKCDPNSNLELDRKYGKKQENSSLKDLLWFVGTIGVVELICIVLAWWYMHMKEGPSRIEKGYVIAASGFKQFSYAELKKATQNFGEVIGRGGSGVVYKAKLPDERLAAVKRLEGVCQDEAEFLAEVSVIGRINHMNLIQVWGFCAEKKHRLLVYEYMERGSLAENLSSGALDWEKRFEIAVGTAKGLAYLHEDCLEWVLHCDVKPQNILLDANYLPKVADFGLSKLRDRRGLVDPSFSRIRGTKGYLAPEWILNEPITSKVDVYSYGIVVLEMVTGRSSYGFDLDYQGDGRYLSNLVAWVRETMSGTNDIQRRIEEIMDPKLDCAYDAVKMELLVRVALQCVEEDKDARPTMTQVAEMLLRHEYDY